MLQKLQYGDADIAPPGASSPASEAQTDQEEK